MARAPLSPITRVLVGLEVFVSIAALGGAVGLAVGAVDFGRETNERLPFDSPALGAVALALVVGAVPACVAVGALGRAAWAPNAHVVVGLVLMGWIVVQVAFIGLVSPLQPFIAAYGVVIVGLALLARRRG